MERGKRNLLAGVLLIAVVLLAGGAFWWMERFKPVEEDSSTTAVPSSRTELSTPKPMDLPAYLPPGKKILYVDSYHTGYPWSDGILAGVKSVLKGRDVELKAIHMDTKRNPGKASKERAGKRVKAFIEKYRPDVVIAADDNAQEYVVARFYKNAKLPIVFCGVNWDASVYGYPFENITGMVEVEPIEALVGHLRKYAKGKRIGFLNTKVLTGEKVARAYNERFFDGKMKVYLAATFEEFKTELQKAQREVDMLIFHNNVGIANWNFQQAETYLRKHLRIPTGSPLEHMDQYVLFTLGKVPQEQGRWAAKTALWILAGKRPTDIPITRNEQFSLTVNLEIAKVLGITIPVSTLRAAAKIIGSDGSELQKAPVTKPQKP